MESYQIFSDDLFDDSNKVLSTRISLQLVSYFWLNILFQRPQSFSCSILIKKVSVYSKRWHHWCILRVFSGYSILWRNSYQFSQILNYHSVVSVLWNRISRVITNGYSGSPVEAIIERLFRVEEKREYVMCSKDDMQLVQWNILGILRRFVMVDEKSIYRHMSETKDRWVQTICYQWIVCTKKGQKRFFRRQDYADCFLEMSRNNFRRLSEKG